MLRCFFLFLFIPHVVFAWGKTGHRAIGELAERHLTSKAKKQVQHLLGKENMADASLWADVVRSNPKYRFQSKWHYINLRDKTSSKENVVWAIDLMVKILKDQDSHPKLNKTQALKLLTHFVADLHQPLHAGRKVDRGGNRLYVRFFNRIYNLHEVWDSEIVEKLDLSYIELADYLNRQYQDTEVLQLSPEDWANESANLLRFVYFFDNISFEGTPPLISHRDILKTYPDILSSKASKNKRPHLRSKYLNRNRPIILKRLYEAGIRLANLINKVY